jgi:hypothetical protein
MQKLVVIAIAAIFGIVVNFLLLYYMNFSLSRDLRNLEEQVAQMSNSRQTSQIVGAPELSPRVATQSGQPSCITCQKDIEEIKKMLSGLTPTGVSFSTIPKTGGTLVKEVFVPLSTGKTSSAEWIDIPGMSATVDTANYSQIKSATFEIALRIPTANGKVYARLFNKTDQHPVWYSEVFSEGPVSTVKQAANLTLDSGNKLYQVQMKSSLGFESIADSAQLKIFLQ